MRLRPFDEACHPDPIAVGYAISHDASLLVHEGRLTWIVAGDPLATGTDAFARVGRIDCTVVSVTTIAVVQIGAIAVAHILAVLVAHVRAVHLLRARSARGSQYPMTLLMLVLTGVAVTFSTSTLGSRPCEAV